MRVEYIKQLLDACYLAKRARDLLPALPEGVLPSYIQYLDAIGKLEAQGLPESVVQQIADSVDCKLYFFDHAVSQGAMYLVLGGSIVVLLGIYILLTRLRKQRG